MTPRRTMPRLRSSSDCPPRYSTPRRPDRATYGPHVAAVAESLGLPLLPWSRAVANVALEVDPATSRLAYREVVVTVPRQSAKTTLALAVSTHRALGFGGRQRTTYTAQTRADARLKWKDDWLPVLDASPLAGLYRVRKRAGQEGLVWRTGSIFGLLAPNEKAGHSKSLDLAILDEAWALTDNAVEQGIRPTMLTARSRRPGSSPPPAPTGRCTCGARWTPAATVQVASHRSDGVLRVERRPGGVAVVHAGAGAHDHRGHRTRRVRRAMLNVWLDEAPHDEWAVIPEPDWRALADSGSAIVGQVAAAVDVTPDRRFASIGVAGRRRDGRMHVEVIEHRPGVGWVAARAREVAEQHRPCVLIVDAGGPAGSLIPDLEAQGLRVTSPTVREIGQAVGAFIDATDPDTSSVRHLGQRPLDAAVAGARLRPLGEASAWARRGPSVAISPLVAVTLAAAGHVRYARLADRPALYVVGEAS